MPAVVLYRRLQPWGISIPYLLDDEFTDIKSAGAVNVTPAVPGPGDRVVTADPASKISISGGALQLAATTAYNAVMRYNPAITRAFGVVLKWSNTAGGTASIVGLSDNTTPADANGRHCFQINTGNQAFVRESGASPMSAALYTLSAGAHRYEIVLRATGAYYFIDELLYWISGVNSAATLYAFLAQISTTATAVIDYVRNPQTKYSVPMLAYAAFGGGDGAL